MHARIMLAGRLTAIIYVLFPQQKEVTKLVLEHKKLNSLDDFFLPLSKRKETGIYFYRFNGFSDEIKTFLNKYYETALKSGVIIDDKIPNPTEPNLAYYEEIMGVDFQISVGFIAASLKKWLPRMNDSQRESVATAIYDSLDELRSAGKTDNMLKNAYIKFMCWLYYKFERITNQLGQDAIPKILYAGQISSYELMILSILAAAGSDVILIQKDADAAYLKLDASSSKSELYQADGLKAFPQDFSLKSFKAEVEQQASMAKLYGGADAIINCTNAWIEGKGLSDILTEPTLRGDDSKFFYNCFCRINGAEDRLTYSNELYQFQLSLKNSKRKLVIVNKEIPKPTPDEIAEINRSNYANANQLISNLQANIQIPSSKDIRGILVKAFVEVMEEEAAIPNINLNKLVNKAVYLLCWIKRYQASLYNNWQYPDVGCFIYMGGCKDANEALFLKFLAKTPVDVLILCPNLNSHCALSDDSLYEINNQTSVNVDTFPEQNGDLRIATAAYHAERDLDQIMYNDSVIFRDQQFSKANTITLQTMDREVKILWDTEIKYRPNFSTMDGVVNIPVVFSKMSGVPDKNTLEYWSTIKQMMTDDTIIVDHVPFISSTAPNPMKAHASEFFKNGKLQKNKIKSHPSYQYSFLREDRQDYILDKLETLIDQRFIKGTFENGTEYTIIATVLNLPKEVIRLIQNFDFTKKNPKLIYLSTTEAMMSLEDTIYVTFLNLIGFDVVFFVPTGYNIEGHFNKRLMEEHQIGDYMYDLQVPVWKTIPSTTPRNWVDKIFKRG